MKSSLNKYWILDYSFYIFNGTYAYRYECSCRKDKQGNPSCKKCGGEGFVYNNYNGLINGGLIHVFQQCINKMKEGYKIITMFDPPKENLYRTDLLSTYKGNRATTPEYITFQMSYGMEMLKYCNNILCYTSERAESDDVMATIALQLANKNHEVVVASDDKDMFPLLEHKNINIYRQKNMFTIEDFYKKFNFNPYRFNEYLSICGDAADNFNLLKGLGPKAAEYLINKYPNILHVYDDIDNVPEKYKKYLIDIDEKTGKINFKDKKEAMKLSLKIATLDYSASYEEIKPVTNIDKFIEKAKYLNLTNVINNIKLFY